MAFLEWLESLSFAVWVRESPSLLAFPALLFIHTLGMALLAGGSALLTTSCASDPAPAPSARPQAAAPKPRPVDRLIIVAIDAGHGGEDPGARGRGGTFEKDVTLAIDNKGYRFELTPPVPVTVLDGDVRGNAKAVKRVVPLSVVP